MTRTSHRRPRRRLRPVLVACAAALLAGCGAEPRQLRDPSPEAPPRSQLESRESPERIARAWWQALRARDTDAVLGQLTPSARRLLDRKQVVRAIEGSLGRWTKPTEATVLYTERSARAATVYMRIDQGELVGRVLVKRGGFMLALPLVLRDDRWLIDNSAWLRSQAAVLEGLKASGL